MQHFNNLTDYSTEQIWQFLDTAKQLKAELKAGENSPILAGKTLGMLFQKPSLRTRVSFEVGMHQLGGQAVYLSPIDFKLGERESIPDVARVLSSYVDGIMARVFSHNDLLELSAYSSVPVINGLSDYNHPCQALTDLFTLWEHTGNLTNSHIVYLGDGNNVAVSLMMIAAKLGVDITIASPNGYTIADEVVAQARDIAKSQGSRVILNSDPVQAVKEADVLYTDVWTSMGQEAEQTERLKVFPPYQVNHELLGKAKPNAIVLHCLPAHRGEEITTVMMDDPRAIVFQQAENRLHAQKAILALLMG